MSALTDDVICGFCRGKVAGYHDAMVLHDIMSHDGLNRARDGHSLVCREKCFCRIADYERVARAYSSLQKTIEHLQKIGEHFRQNAERVEAMHHNPPLPATVEFNLFMADFCDQQVYGLQLAIRQAIGSAGAE